MDREKLNLYIRNSGLLPDHKKNILDYVEIYRDDYLLIKRRKMNIRVMGLNLIHNYLKRCDGDVQLLMEINELQLKLQNVRLSAYVTTEINKMLNQKISQYEASKRIVSYLDGITEFERVISKYKTKNEILDNSEAIIYKIRKHNPAFDPLKYIENYYQRSAIPGNPFLFDDISEMSKHPRKRLKKPKGNDIFGSMSTEL